ncbi:hypothetical protein HCR_23110 (plasmid) [Hydrogenimonas cancrithermarum]|uniref:Transposase n=1 Tax=Hydrogenimonas cancrithermarum TaxID=2993563 RepID=A0ABN6WXT8_9BACT|nr:hypothetical protein HCR_23110 [Hydrogenimonas cancrithermarum]
MKQAESRRVVRTNKVVKPSSAKRMAKRAVVEKKGITIRLACKAFGLSESCYHYEAKLNEE